MNAYGHSKYMGIGIPFEYQQTIVGTFLCQRSSCLKKSSCGEYCSTTCAKLDEVQTVQDDGTVLTVGDRVEAPYRLPDESTVGWPGKILAIDNFSNAIKVKFDPPCKIQVVGIPRVRPYIAKAQASAAKTAAFVASKAASLAASNASLKAVFAAQHVLELRFECLLVDNAAKKLEHEFECAAARCAASNTAQIAAGSVALLVEKLQSVIDFELYLRNPVARKCLIENEC